MWRPSALAPLQQGDPRRVSRWKLEGRLGAGGMGTVFLGTGDGGEQAAVKLIHAGLATDPAFRSRFRREVALTQRVRGAQIARVLGADAEAERPWLATEYVSGPDLATAVRFQGPLPPATLTTFALAAIVALRQIHAAGVVHRDLKPSNIVLSAGTPVVIDFGIAAAADSTSLTSTGAMVGSVGWMAPEQIRGEPADTAADIFGWGATVAFAGTGRSPFGDGPPQTVMYRVLHEGPDLEGLDGDLRTLCESALAKTPDQRPSVESLTTALGLADAGDAETLIHDSWTSVGLAPLMAFDRPRVAIGRGRFRKGWWPGAVASLALAFAGVVFVAVRPQGSPTSSTPTAAVVARAPTTSRVTTAPATSPQATRTVATTPKHAIEKVDWSNRTYEVDCLGDVERFKLVDGRFGTADTGDAHVRLFEVHFADFDRDGVQDATVDIGCTVGAGTVTEQILLFKELGESVIRFGDAITATYIERDGSQFVTYDGEYERDDPRCCPSNERVSRYRFNSESREGFEMYTSKVLPKSQVPERKAKW